MKIEWKEDACSSWGTAEMPFPRFEAWPCDDYVEDSWRLDMLRSPNSRPIGVRGLQSLDAAKEFAEGLLAEFAPAPDRGLPVTVGRNSGQRYAPRPALCATTSQA